MSFETYFPVWDKLNTCQKNRILDGLTARQVKKGTILHNGSMDCTGLLLVRFVLSFFLTRGVRSLSIACLTGIYACFPPPAWFIPFSLK